MTIEESAGVAPSDSFTNSVAELKEADRAAKVTKILITQRRITPWEAGFCNGLHGHAPTPRQFEILARLEVKYDIDLASVLNTEVQTQS
jgi:hypothetical protein